MNNQTMVDEVTRTAKGTFLPGHKKIGGRAKGTPSIQSWFAREVAQSKGFNPIGIALDVFTTGYLPLAPGEDPKKRRRISDELRVKVLLDVCNYLFPKLTATQVTGRDGGPLRVASATLDMNKLLADSELARAAQALSLAATEQSRPNGETLADTWEEEDSGPRQ